MFILGHLGRCDNLCCVTYMKSCETALKEMMLRKCHFSIVHACVSQILKISIATFKQYICENSHFHIVSTILRSQIVFYCIFSKKCHHSMISPMLEGKYCELDTVSVTVAGSFMNTFHHGILTVGEGSVQLTSLYYFRSAACLTETNFSFNLS